MKTIRKSMTIYDEHQQMLNELIELLLASGESDVVRRAIFALYKETKNPTHDKRRNDKPKMSPANFAEKLYRAEFIDQPDGSQYVKFPTYLMSVPGTVEEGELTIPVAQVTEDTLKNQFDGNKEAIINIIENHNG